MKEIKTIVFRLDNAKDFDKEVNEAIRSGFVLEKRYLSEPKSHPTNGDYLHTMLIAEMSKDDDNN